jgi:hypothetical protein
MAKNVGRAKSTMLTLDLQAQQQQQQQQGGNGTGGGAKKGLFGVGRSNSSPSSPSSKSGPDRRASVKRGSVQIGGPGNTASFLGGGGDDESSSKPTRRLSMAGLTSPVLTAKPGQQGKGKGKGGGSGGGGGGGRPRKGSKDGGGGGVGDKNGKFVIRHPLYGRREYDHHFVGLSAVVATWNVGGHAVTYADLGGLKKWLLESLPAMPMQPGEASLAEAAAAAAATGSKGNGIGNAPGNRSSTSLFARNCPDVYVLGLQEIVDFNAKNVMLSNEESQNRGREWLDIFKCILPREHEYELVASKSMVGIFICVFIKGSKLPGVSAVRSTNVGVGLMGTGGNKGSVAVSLRYGVSSLCFMTAHLAAHQENVEGRCSDYRNIVARLDFRAEKSDNADIAGKGVEWCVVKKCPLYASIGTKSKELRQLELGETLREVQRVVKKDGRTWVQFKDGWCPTKKSGIMGEKLIVQRSNEKALATPSPDGLASGEGGDDDGNGTGGSSSSNPVVVAAAAAAAAAASGGAGGGSIKALDHDVMFFFGDLNFRLNDISLEDAYRCIEAGDLEQMLE